jgi:hypothetical protein
LEEAVDLSSDRLLMNEYVFTYVCIYMYVRLQCKYVGLCTYVYIVYVCTYVHIIYVCTYVCIK